MADDGIKDKEKLSDAGHVTQTSDYELEEQSQKRLPLKLGYVGRLWGGEEEKAGNIAGIAVLASFLLLVAVIAVIVFRKITDDNIAVLREAFTVVVSVLTLSLGYLFGHGNSRGR